jgi:hypothetical protein
MRVSQQVGASGLAHHQLPYELGHDPASPCQQQRPLLQGASAALTSSFCCLPLQQQQLAAAAEHKLRLLEL